MFLEKFPYRFRPLALLQVLTPKFPSYPLIRIYSEPGVNLSAHRAPIIRPLVSDFAFSKDPPTINGRFPFIISNVKIPSFSIDLNFLVIKRFKNIRFISQPEDFQINNFNNIQFQKHTIIDSYRLHVSQLNKRLAIKSNARV